MIDAVGMLADANAITPSREIGSDPLAVTKPFGSHRGLFLSVAALMLQRKIKSLRRQLLRWV